VGLGHSRAVACAGARVARRRRPRGAGARTHGGPPVFGLAPSWHLTPSWHRRDLLRVPPRRLPKQPPQMGGIGLHGPTRTRAPQGLVTSLRPPRDPRCAVSRLEPERALLTAAVARDRGIRTRARGRRPWPQPAPAWAPARGQGLAAAPERPRRSGVALGQACGCQRARTPPPAWPPSRRQLGPAPTCPKLQPLQAKVQVNDKGKAKKIGSAAGRVAGHPAGGRTRQRQRRPGRPHQGGRRGQGGRHQGPRRGRKQAERLLRRAHHRHREDFV
jgi:hypothetical protein